MTETRDADIAAFLRAAGWGDGDAAPLAGDASNRRYLRLASTTATAVLMDAPPDRGEDVGAFIAMTGWLREQGLSAPAILAADMQEGLLLLEDLGDNLFVRHLERHPAEEADLYGAAVDLLAGLAASPPPARIGPAAVRRQLPPYDRATLDREAALFTEWWLPAASRGPVSSGMAEEFLALVREATAEVAAARDVVVLRDYHAENLVWLPGRSGVAKVGLLDYQDALAGHCAYDLVSLLEDARRDTAPALREAMIRRYLAGRPDLDERAFRAACSALGAQRNLKIVGIFARLARRDGKPRYLSLIPRVWAHLMGDLRHPSLAPLRAWIGRNAPPPDPGTLARVRETVPA